MYNHTMLLVPINVTGTLSFNFHAKESGAINAGSALRTSITYINKYYNVTDL